MIAIPDIGSSDGYEFRYRTGGREVIVRCDWESDLSDLLESFEMFLRAVGVDVPGSITCEEEPPPKEADND